MQLYSDLSVLAGLISAALIEWKLTVVIAMNTGIVTAKAYVHHEIVVWYANV